MATRLRKLRINELSLVDAPANPHARIVLFKRIDNFVKNIRNDSSEPTSLVEATRLLRRRSSSLSRTGALRIARETYPHLYDAYQAEGVTNARNAAPVVQKSAAVLQFDKRIDAVLGRDQCSRINALRAAAREFPAELENYRTALA